VSLVADQGFTDINICYSSPRGDDLDTRLLRAMVIKGILEEITTARVNLVNADLLAKNRGLRISEVTVTSNGRWVGGVSVLVFVKRGVGVREEGRWCS
jgi:D-3-phosphoglycerate dehydrogenase